MSKDYQALYCASFEYRKGFPLIALIPKNGSTSIRKAIEPGRKIAHLNDVTEHPVRVMFMRDPFDRLASFYNFQRQVLFKYPKTILDPSFVHVKSYEEFLDVALLSDNIHCYPQVKQVTLKGQFMPTNVHKLSDILTAWELYYPDEFITRENQSKPLKINSDYRHSDVLCRYKDDFELWRSL